MSIKNGIQKNEGGDRMLNSQSQKIETAITQHLDNGMTKKTEIYDKVVNDLAVPRPTVRRVARDLRTKLQERITILNGTPEEAKISDA